MAGCGLVSAETYTFPSLLDVDTTNSAFDLNSVFLSLSFLHSIPNRTETDVDRRCHCLTSQKIFAYVEDSDSPSNSFATVVRHQLCQIDTNFEAMAVGDNFATSITVHINYLLDLNWDIGSFSPSFVLPIYSLCRTRPTSPVYSWCPSGPWWCVPPLMWPHLLHQCRQQFVHQRRHNFTSTFLRWSKTGARRRGLRTFWSQPVAL